MPCNPPSVSARMLRFTPRPARGAATADSWPISPRSHLSPGRDHGVGYPVDPDSGAAVVATFLPRSALERRCGRRAQTSRSPKPPCGSPMPRSHLVIAHRPLTSRTDGARVIAAAMVAHRRRHGAQLRHRPNVTRRNVHETWGLWSSPRRRHREQADVPSTLRAAATLRHAAARHPSLHRTLPEAFSCLPQRCGQRGRGAAHGAVVRECDAARWCWPPPRLRWRGRPAIPDARPGGGPRQPACIQQPTTMSPSRSALVSPRRSSGHPPWASSGRWVMPTVGRPSSAPRCSANPAPRG